MVLNSGYWPDWSSKARCLSVKPWCYWLWRPRNSPIQDYVHPDGHDQPTYVQTQSAPTARTLSTLHTVKNVLWPYRPYDCIDSVVVTHCMRRSNRKFWSNLSARSSGKAMHYWNISDFFLNFSKSTGALFCFFLFSVHIFGSILELSLWVFLATEWINECYFIFLMLKAWFLR